MRLPIARYKSYRNPLIFAFFIFISSRLYT